MITGFWSQNVLLFILSIVFWNQNNSPAFQFNPTANEYNFIVYSDKPFYGLNVDNNRGEIRFRISTEHKHRVLFFDILDNSVYYPFAAVNDQGVFIATQDVTIQSPPKYLTISEFENMFGDILFNNSSIPDIRNIELGNSTYIVNNKVIMFADINQNAFYTETLNNISRLVLKTNSFLIASPYIFSLPEETNSDFFQSADFNYRKLQASLEERQANFSIMNGFNALGSASPSSNEITSIVLDPAQNKIYIALLKDYEKIWMINLDGLTVETFSGFDKYHKGNVPKGGITSNDLRILNFSNESLMEGVILGSLGILIILLIPQLTVLLKNRKK
jgi:hypothetical protein